MGEYDLRVQQAIKDGRRTGWIMQLICGVFAIVLLPCLLVALLFLEDDVFVMLPVVLILGLVLIILGNLSRKGRLRRHYAKLADGYWLRLQMDPARSLDRLAQTLGKRPAQIYKDMQKILAHKLYPGAALNGMQLILPPDAEQPRIPAVMPMQTDSVLRDDVTCPCCGATHSGVGRECEYCGSPL